MPGSGGLSKAEFALDAAFEIARRELSLAVLSALSPERHLPILSWVEENVWINAKPFRGNWSNETVPLCKEFYEEIERGYYWKFVLLASTQSSKSMIGVLNPTLYNLAMRRDCALCFPTKSQLKSFWNSRVAPALQRLPELLARFPEEMRETGKLRGACEPVHLADGTTFWPLWAGSDTQLSSSSFPNLVLDEVGKYERERESGGEGSPPDQAIERTSAFEDRQVIMACTLTDQESRIYAEFKAGSEGLVYVPCPRCAGWIALEFDGAKAAKFFPDRPAVFTSLRYDAENEKVAVQSAELECPLCQKRFGDLERKEALAHSTWAHAGETIDAKGNVKGERKPTRVWSGRWNRLYWPGRSLGSMAAEMREANTRGEQTKKSFQIYSEALPYEEDLRVTELTREWLKRRSDKSDYDFGQVPRGVEFAVAAWDMQKRDIFWITEGADREGRTWTIDYGVQDIRGEEPGAEQLFHAMDVLADVFQKGWTREGVIIQPEIIGIDTGGERAHLIQEWLKRRGARYQGLKGLGQGQGERMTGKTTFSLPGLLEIKMQGSGIYLWFIRTDGSKSLLLDRFMIADQTAPGFHALPRGIDGKGRDWYTYHLTAEKRETQFDAMRGNVTRFEKVRKANHLMDASGYCQALIEYWRYQLRQRDGGGGDKTRNENARHAGAQRPAGRYNRGRRNYF